jgi:hypothetical protein
LITGGAAENQGALSSAELYDPATGTFSRTGNMTVARRMHTATRLTDGRVLIAGGWDVSTAELYNPETGTFTATGAMIEDQAGHIAALLPNGNVLIAGGMHAARPWPTAARPELYDPETGSFSLAGTYATTGGLYPAGGPIWPTANLLPDGKVLVVGENPPEIYDPASGTFSTTGKMIDAAYQYGMFWHTSTSLKDGTVLVTGGNDDLSCTGFVNAELYDPSSGTFTVVGNMTAPRDGHTATLLQQGTVLLAGGGPGWCSHNTLDSAELYDPANRSFVAAGKMTRRRSFYTATLLNDGTVLLAGGVSYWPFTTTRSAERYLPIRDRHRVIRTR